MTLSIRGLSCGGGGALTVERALEKVSGVGQAYVNPATEMAYIEYDADLTGTQHLIAAVERLGFGAGEPNVR
jgi:Cu+-exporting ATPase